MIHFTVPGEPVGKGRVADMVRNGITMKVTPKKTRDYESMVAQLAKTEMLGLPLLDGPIIMRIYAHYGIGASWSKTKKEDAITSKTRPTKKPDLSNVIKAIEDACNGIVYKDDSAIVHLIATKAWSNEPRVEVQIEMLAIA